jgi:hypothetical protein
MHASVYEEREIIRERKKELVWYIHLPSHRKEPGLVQIWKGKNKDI